MLQRCKNTARCFNHKFEKVRDISEPSPTTASKVDNKDTFNAYKAAL